MADHGLLEGLEPEWPHLVEADEIEDEAVSVTISPDEAQVVALCQRLGVKSFQSLSAELTLSRMQGNMVVHVEGRVKAELTQDCVVTLDPVVSSIDEAFEGWFADSEQAASLIKAKRDRLTKSGAGEVPVLDESEDPEAIVEGQIDVGELVTQHLSLLISAYPHAEGVEYEYGDDDPKKVPEEFKNNPFEALKDWKSKLED